MSAVEHIIAQHGAAAWAAIILSFIVLFKSADAFVDASVGLAERFHIPRLLIGIVLVSLATTAPELSVSLTAALRGSPEMALGNAIGSVICDDGLALGLAGIVAAGPIAVMPAVLMSTGLFLIVIQAVTFMFILGDCTLSRWEGMVLVLLFVGYIAMLYIQHRHGAAAEETKIVADRLRSGRSLARLLYVFFIAVAGIIVASELIISSAAAIARSFQVSEAVIALTLVAFGTSIPEVATCVTAARKGEGALAVGNILGADIMNICWVAGASAVANSLTISRQDFLFMFPSMFIIVAAMLGMLRFGYCLTRSKGIALLALYAVYLASFFILFKPGL